MEEIKKISHLSLLQLRGIRHRGTGRIQAVVQLREEDYSASKINWEVDYPQKVHCERCKQDMTNTFMEYNILPIFGEPPLE